MSPTLRFLRRFGPLLVLAAALGWALQSGLLGHLSLDELAARRRELTAFVAAHPMQALAAFVAAEFAVAMLGTPGSGVLTLAGGLFFGVWLGGAAALTGATAGSIVFFLVCRGAFGDVLARRAGPKVAKFEEGFRDNAFAYLLSLRLLPIAPMPLTNLAAALFEAPLRAFVAATAIGMIPMTLVIAGLGAGFGEAMARGERPSLKLAAEPHILLPLLGVTLLALLPAALALWRRRGRAVEFARRARASLPNRSR